MLKRTKNRKSERGRIRSVWIVDENESKNENENDQ